MQKLTLNYTRLQEHTHLLIHVYEHIYVVYIRTRIYIEVRWYPYFVAQE